MLYHNTKIVMLINCTSHKKIRMGCIAINTIENQEVKTSKMKMGYFLQ